MRPPMGAHAAIEQLLNGPLHVRSFEVRSSSTYGVVQSSNRAAASDDDPMMTSSAYRRAVARVFPA
jgi:hypothetical protein